MRYFPLLLGILFCRATTVPTVGSIICDERGKTIKDTVSNLIPSFRHKAKHGQRQTAWPQATSITHIGIVHTPSRAARTSTRRQSQSTVIGSARQAIVLHSQDETGHDTIVSRADCLRSGLDRLLYYSSGTRLLSSTPSAPARLAPL